MVERILVVAPHLGALTDFARTLDDLTARRCHVHVAVAGDPPAGTDLAPFTGKFHRLTVGPAPPPVDEWLALGSLVRGWLDCWRHLAPNAGDEQTYRQALVEAPPLAAWFASRRWLRAGIIRPGITKMLAAVERTLPSSPHVIEFLRAQNPDVLVVVPLFGVGSTAPAYVQAAAELGIATIGFPTKWDDVTHGAVLHRLPDCLAVWNRVQRRRVVERRGVPASRTIILGASLPLDIVRDPQTTRAEHRRQFGLDPQRPVIVMAAGATRDHDAVRAWIEAVRASSESSVRDAQVLIHVEPPAGVQQSEDTRFAEATVVPRAESDPTHYPTEIARALSCADIVVAVDTTLIFEAAARGVPVLALLWPDGGDPSLARFAADEEVSRGWLVTARSLAEHTSALAMLLTKAVTAEQQAAGRVIVRPHGLDLLPGFLMSVRALQEVRDRRAERPLATPASAGARGLLRPFARLALRRAGTSTAPHGGRFARVLIAIASAKTLFLHQPLLRTLAERGHHLTIVYTARARVSAESYDKVKCDVPGVGIAGVLSERTDGWAEYTRLLIGAFSLGALVGSRRAMTKPPVWLTRYAQTVLPGRPRVLASLMRRAELAARMVPRLARLLAGMVPPSTAAATVIAGTRPDVVVVLPDDDAVAAFEGAAPQFDLVRAAASSEVPVVMAAGASELRLSPSAVSGATYMCVWNDEQSQLAQKLGVPATQLVVTGPLLLDRCLHDAPIVDASTFREMLGLPAGRPFVFVAGSSGLLSEPGEEVNLIREWVSSLRESADPALRDLTVLVRPAPLGSRWRGIGFGDDPRVVVSPRDFERSGELDAVLLAESVRFSAVTISADPLTLSMASALERPAAIILPPRHAAAIDAVPLDFLLHTPGSRATYMPTLAELSAYVSRALSRGEVSAESARAGVTAPPYSAAVVAECVARAARAAGKGFRNTIQTALERRA